jgi:hypothetical protein
VTGTSLTFYVNGSFAFEYIDPTWFAAENTTQTRFSSVTATHLLSSQKCEFFLFLFDLFWDSEETSIFNQQFREQSEL